GCLWGRTNGISGPMTRGIAPLTAMALLTLGAGSILLLTLTVAEILEDDDVPQAKIEWTPKLSVSIERLHSASSLNAYQQTTAHPIFLKPRQPFVPPPPPAPPPPPSRPVAQPTPAPPPIIDPSLAVGGVMITGGVKKAYLFRKGERSGSWL